MRDPCPLPMRLAVHHPKLNVPVLCWRNVEALTGKSVRELLFRLA
ncbi:hypothetical protein [Pseudomonas nunensis]|nr:hypothetical protein [Pseudomonas nunensis]